MIRKNNPLISIIISTRNKKVNILKETLNSILSQKYHNCEIIIIDQNTNSEIKKMLDKEQSLSCVFYYKSKEIGLSRGRNIGFAKARGKWILFFDDDAFLQKDFFRKLNNYLEKINDENIIFYGNVLNLENSLSFIKRKINTKYLYLWNFDSICSIGIIFSRKAIDSVGLFDENFGVGSKFGAGEESDLIIRALNMGYKIKYLKNIIVYHPKAKNNLKKKYLYGYGLGAVYRKQIFSSFGCFFVLGIKFIGEISLRIILGFISLFNNFEKYKFHISYLRGFIRGFFSYKK